MALTQSERVMSTLQNTKGFGDSLSLILYRFISILDRLESSI